MIIFITDLRLIEVNSNVVFNCFFMNFVPSIYTFSATTYSI